MRNLWRSDISGRVRRGTRVSELRLLFEDGVTARAIFEPLYCCLLSDSAVEVRQQLDRLDFDEVGVTANRPAAPHGYVTRTDLQRVTSCAECLQEFRHDDLIADTTPLLDVLSALSESSRRYVLAGRSVTGTVTRADLQKPPVRMMMFGMVTLLEMHLSYLVNRLYSDGIWQERLAAARLDKARDLLQQRKERGEDLGLLQCLQLCDKRDLLVASEPAREVLGVRSRKHGTTVLKEVEDLRNRVAHAQDLVSGTDWETIVSLVTHIEQMIESCEQYLDGANGV